MVQEPKSTSPNWQPPHSYLSQVLFALTVGFWAFGLSAESTATQFLAFFPSPIDTAGADSGPISAPTLDDFPNSIYLPPLPVESAAHASRPSGEEVAIPKPSVSHSSVTNPMVTNWTRYCEMWRQHHMNPSSLEPRSKLGIVQPGSEVKVSSGLASAATLRLPGNAMQRYETEHFAMLSDATPTRATEVIREMERFYLVWTQFFFPLWREREHWDRTETTPQSRSNPTPAKHAVVLFADSVHYSDYLKGEAPGVEQSTGFYSDLKRITFLHDAGSSAESSKTRQHELTHQLLSEATDGRPRLRPGERREFWVVEGIACYMESIHFFESGIATIGGWQAERLQFARHRVFALGDQFNLSRANAEGRLQVQRQTDLSRWYSFASVHTHRIIDADHGQGLIDLLSRLAAIYQLRVTSFTPSDEAAPIKQAILDEALIQYLQINDTDLNESVPSQLTSLCLTRTAVTAAGLARIPPQTSLQWLDLSFLPVGTLDVTRLCPSPATLEQLSLEATKIDPSVGSWLAAATKLKELDLSSTQVDDTVLGQISPEAPLETLWLTGTLVSDSSIDSISKMRSLARVDLQLSAVSDEGIARLKSSRPDLLVNPLEITSP